MLVRLKTGIASVEWSYAPGQVVDVETALAKAWIESGIAERATPEKPDAKTKGAK